MITLIYLYEIVESKWGTREVCSVGFEVGNRCTIYKPKLSPGGKIQQQ